MPCFDAILRLRLLCGFFVLAEPTFLEPRPSALAAGEDEPWEGMQAHRVPVAGLNGSPHDRLDGNSLGCLVAIAVVHGHNFGGMYDIYIYMYGKE